MNRKVWRALAATLVSVNRNRLEADCLVPIGDSVSRPTAAARLRRRYTDDSYTSFMSAMLCSSGVVTWAMEQLLLHLLHFRLTENLIFVGKFFGPKSKLKLTPY